MSRVNHDEGRIQVQVRSVIDPSAGTSDNAGDFGVGKSHSGVSVTMGGAFGHV